VINEGPQTVLEPGHQQVAFADRHLRNHWRVRIDRKAA
jgi:hypothetical protein